MQTAEQAYNELPDNQRMSKATAAWAADDYLKLACRPDVVKLGHAAVKHYMDSSAHYALLARYTKAEN